MSRIQHTSFIASQGANGWYTTVEDNEIIKFENPLNGLIIETDTDELAIKVDDFSDIWHIGANDKEGIEGLKIEKIQILNPTGVKIRWKGLTY